jgi:hypothetical protein
MAKIFAPNKQYDGISAGIKFINGVGECADPHLIDWFKSKGYEVEVIEEKKAESKFDNMTVDELKAYAESNKIDIGMSTSQKGILKKILEAEKESE